MSAHSMLERLDLPTEQVAALFSEVLPHHGAVARDDDFFDIGGDSIAALRLVALVEQATGVRVPLSELYNGSTPRRVAELVAGMLTSDVRRPSRLARRDCRIRLKTNQLTRLVRLRAAQERGVDPARCSAYPFVHVTSMGFVVRGPLDVEAFRRAVRFVTDRHDALHARVVWEDRAIVATLATASTVIELELVDGGSVEDEHTAARELVERARAPFDLGCGVLARFLLRRFDDDVFVFAIGVDHLVSDGGSFDVILDELAAAYASFCDDGEPELGGRPVQMAEANETIEELAAGPVGKAAFRYWHKMLDGRPWAPMRLPGTDMAAIREPQAPVVSRIRVSDRNWAAVQTELRRRRLSLTMLGAACIARAAVEVGQDSLVGILTPISNRFGFERVVGWLAHNITIPLRPEEVRVPGVLETTQARCLEAYSHCVISDHELARRLSPGEWTTSRATPVFYMDQYAPRVRELRGGVGMEPVVGSLTRPELGLEVLFRHDAGHLELEVGSWDGIVPASVREAFDAALVENLVTLCRERSAD